MTNGITAASSLLLLLALLLFSSPACRAADAAAPVDNTMADSAAATAPRLEAPKGILALDFGATDAFEGFRANTGGDGVIFSGNVRFEKTERPDVQPDSLVADYVTADYLKLIDLKPGLTRLALLVKNVGIGMVAASDWAVKVNGQTVISETVTPETFFSDKGLFYGMQFEDFPGTNWWRRYVEAPLRWRIIEADSDGTLTIHLENARLFALVAANAEVPFAQFESFLMSTDQARRKVFYETRFKFDPAVAPWPTPATEQDRARGFVIFTRHWSADVNYSDVPAPEEFASRLAVSAAPGERAIVPLTIRTLEEREGVTIAVSELSGPAGKLPLDAVEITSVRFRPQARYTGDWELTSNFDLVPDVLQPAQPVDIPEEISKSWWIFVNVPSDAAAGSWRGAVTITTAEGVRAQLPLDLTVYPFRLAPVAASLGVFYADPSTLNYHTSLLGGTASLWRAPYDKPALAPEADERNRKIEDIRLAMLEADLADISRRGFNGVTTPLPRVTAVSPEAKVTLDTSLTDAYLKLLPRYGLNTTFAGQSHLLDLGRQIARVGVDGKGMPEYSDLHAAAYKDGYSQIADYFTNAGVSMLAYVVDEPREHNINAWNRNLMGTLYYLGLVNEVGKWPSTVTNMADTQNGISYMPILEAEDVVQPHPGTRDVQSVEYARKNGKPLRYFNGSGFNRFEYGFYVWSQKPEGMWQWHYQFWGLAWNPVWQDDGGHAVYPSPSGPVATLRWERAAQGIYDYRYALTLEDYIAKAKASGNADAVAAASDAESFLAGIRSASPLYLLDDDWQPLGVSEETMIKWKAGLTDRILKLHSLLSL
jgi:hypothetical protein